MATAIEFQQVGKRFDFDPNQAQTVLESVVKRFRHQNKVVADEFWAVQDVSFKLAQGESLGLIGRNGSGKSTLLKLAAGILRPTNGRMRVNGRISALLELGAGFHADLTGQENIFLNGSVLGLSKKEIEARYDDILAFSELGEFINMQVKHYSSGMYMRLGFSVAVHVNPDILIVDEILAVGDYAFQKKCLNRIRDLQNAGTTIVMVSHDINSMRNLCSHLIWLDKGKMVEMGNFETVSQKYMAEMRGDVLSNDIHAGGFQRIGSGEIEITAVRFLNAVGDPQNEFNFDEPFSVEITYEAHRPILEPEFGLVFLDYEGHEISRPNNLRDQQPFGTVDGAGVIQYDISSNIFVSGVYKVTVAIYDAQLMHAFDHHEQAYQFRIKSPHDMSSQGLVRLVGQWQQIVG